MQRIEQLEELLRRNTRSSDSRVERASYEFESGEVETGQLVPSQAFDTALTPVPVINSSFSPGEPASQSQFVPRNPDASYHNWFTNLYYVGDIFPHPSRNHQSMMVQPGENDAREAMYQKFGEQMIDTIKRQIEPHSWLNNDIAKIRYFPGSHSLIVTQTHSNHQEIKLLLEEAKNSQDVFPFQFQK